MPGHHHRSGGLKQANKKNKRSKSSKRSISRNAGGKVAGKQSSGATMLAQSKADRKNNAQQKRDAKRQEILRQKRGIGGSAPPPRIVGIISLGNSVEIEERVRSAISKGADKVFHPHDNRDATVTCRFDAHKKAGNLTLLTCHNSFVDARTKGADAVLSALDLARICDVIIFVIDGNTSHIEENVMEIRVSDDPSVSTNKSNYGLDWSHLIGNRGDRILKALKSQGLPTPLTLLAHSESNPLSVQDDDCMTMQSMKSLRRSCTKRSLDLKRYVSRFATTEFGKGKDKVLDIDLTKSDDDFFASAGLVRTLCSMSCSAARWVSNLPRSYLLSDTVKYNPNSKELSLTGFVRGSVPFDVNSLVHIPTLGTFPCKDVKSSRNPLNRETSQNQMSMEESTQFISPNPELQESSNMFATPDALDGEQNLIGFDDTDNNIDDVHAAAFERPAGWSDYQSSWLDAVDKDTFDDHVDKGELAEQLNSKKAMNANASAGMNEMDIDDANEVSAEERNALMQQRRKEQNEDLEFPDEVQVDEDEKARERFDRYRSLKSFRNSFWDPKENLPDSYSSIFHFSSFKSTQRAIMNDMKDVAQAAESSNGRFFGAASQDDAAMGDDEETDDILEGCVPSGSYVTLTLQNIPSSAMSRSHTSSLLVGVALLPHENKVSVLHMGLSQTSTNDEDEKKPIKSKDTLTFRCGWRTWQARPVFSQNNLNCDKHKFERFLPQGGTFFAASVFGPVTYTPNPVLVFRNNGEDEALELVASGTMLGADADRIVVKRIILTGYPVRVHKRHATVKYMFYNPEDVTWFKPAELYTKHGLQGNIIESVGEHGTMKCLFNAPVKQHDTICLPLYKRIYPKFVQQRNDQKHDGMTYRETQSLTIW